jgi:outer membrane protein assembly factor BamA/autotransporter translocation and assembly factor TamB
VSIFPVDPEAPVPRRSKRRAVRALAAAGAVFVALAAIAHLPRVRARVLVAALDWANGRFGVEARARGLDYNLLTLRFTLHAPTVAARHAADKPFFAADRVEVDLPWTWLTGARSLQALRIDGPRLTLATDAMDRFNLPTIRGAGGGGSMIDIGELALRDISLVVDDRVRRIGLQVQRTSVRLAGARDGALEGRLRMGAPGALRIDAWETTVTRLDAAIGLDGGVLRLAPLTIGTADGAISLRGTAGLSADAPIDLVVGAQVHLTRLVSSLAPGVHVAGTVEVSGLARGTVAEPAASLTVRAPSVVWAALAPAVIGGDLAVSRHDVELKTLTLQAPWGRIQASGRVADRDARAASRVDVAWTGVDAGGVIAAAGTDLPFRIGTSVTGRGTIEWQPGASGAVSLHASSVAAPRAGPGIPVGGRVRVDKAGAQWTVVHDVTGPGGLRASGRIGVTRGAGASALSGTTQATAGDLGAALASLAAAGLEIDADVVSAVDGTARAQVEFAGTMATPRVSIEASSDRARYAPLPDAQVDARLVIERGRVTIDAATARFRTGTARATGVTIDTRDDRLAGAIAADIEDVSAVAAALWPEAGPVTGAASADGQFSGTLGRPRVTAGVVALDVAAAGQRFDRFEGDVIYEEPRLVWRGARVAQGTGTLSTDGWMDLRREQFEVAADGTGLALGECPAGVDLCGGGVPVAAAIDRLVVSAHGSFERPTGTLDVSARDVRWKGEGAGALVGRAVVSDGTATVSARMPDHGVGLAGTIGVPSPSPFDLTLTAADSELATLLRLGGRAADAGRVGGSISATVRVVGDFDHLDQAAIDASVAPASLVVDGRRWYTQQAARVEYSPARIAVSGLTLGIGESILAVTGGLRREGGESLRLALDGAIGDLAGAVDLGDVDVSGVASGRFVVSGTPTAPLVAGTATLTATTVTHPKATVSIDRLTATLDGGMVRVERASLTSRGAHATVDAAVPVSVLRDRLPEAALRALGAPPGDARATLGADLSVDLADTGLLPDTSLPLAGALAGRLDLEAAELSLDALRGTGLIQTADLAVGASRIAQASPGRLTIDRGRVTLDPWTITGSGTNLLAAGSIVLGGDGSLPIAATLTGPLVLEPLQALLEIPISGRVTADVRVNGTATEPRAAGTLALAESGLRVGRPRIALADVHGNVRLDGTVAHFEGITGLVNGAPFTLAGSAVLPGAPSSGTHTLRLEAQRVPVQPFATGPRAETDLDLTYTDEAGQRQVTGRADLLPQPFRGSVLALKQFVDAVGATNAPIGAEPRRRKPGTSPITLKIAIDSREPFLVDTSAGRVELAARLTIEGSVDQPSLLGRVTVLEDGVIRAGGRKYTIASGTIDFTNPRRVVPLINLTATTKISTYDITMVLAGTPDALRTSLNSDPPLSESDLRSLIVTGRIASQSMERGDSQSERTVVESISGDVLGFAAEAVGLDAVSIGNPDLDLLGSDIDAATSLNITKSVSRQVDVVYSRDLQDDRSAFLVIYRPTRAYSFRVLSRDNTEGAVEFRHELRFGGPPGARRAAPRPAKRPRIVSIAFTGDRGFSDAQLAKALRLDVGSKFDTWQWRGETDRLARLYRDSGFYAVRIVARRDARDGGVALEYAITRGPRTTLAIDGHEMPDDVLDEMRDAWSESVSTAFLVEDLERIARTHLVDDGHLTPEVKAEVAVQTAAAQAVLLHVKAGPLAKSRQIDVQGVSSGMRTKLRDFLDTSRLDRTAWYDPAGLKAPVEAFFRDRGHLEVKVTPGAVRVEGERAVLPVSVDEGRLFHVTRIEVEGADVLGEEKVRTATGVKVDAPWEAAYLGLALANVERAYDDAGFPDTEVYVESQTDATAGQVTLYVAVAEGQRRILQDLAISGTHDTLPKTVSDLVKLRFGDPVTPALVSDVQKRLYDVGVFSRVSVDLEPAPGGSRATSTHDDPVVARVTVLEAPRYSIQYGLQVSKTLQATATESEYKPGASVDFRDRNFLGRAMGLGIGTRFDARQKSGRMTFALPRTYGTSIRSYLFLDRSWETTIPESGFETTDDQASISAEQRWRRSKNLEFSWGVAYDYRDLGLAAVGDTRTDLLKIVGDTVGPRIAVVWDSRDDPFDSRRGFFHSSGLDVGLPPLGSDLSYSRFLIQNFLFVPKGPLVFASGARYGGLTTWGPDSPIVLDLLFQAGGSRSVRGYAEDTLSAVDIFGVPLGGQQMLVLNQEVRFPLWWWFRGAAFVDAGNTFANAATFALDKLKVGTGWGLRLATPVALVRFDVGYPVNNGPSHAPRYYLSIGQSF